MAEHMRMPAKEGLHKNNWISDLVKSGLAPVFVFIDTAPEEEHKEREYYWINHFSKLGVLFNHKIKKDKK